MAIQFFCSGCGQPIEVDDNMVNLAVTCPYCRKVVTTPPTSTLAAGPSVPMPPAAPPTPGLPTSPMAMQEPVPLGVAGLAARKKAVLGWIGLVSAVLTVALGLYASQTFVSLMQGLNLQPKNQQEREQIAKEFQERVQHRPGFMLGACSGWCVFPVAAIVCGIIGLVRREQPRWPSIASLIMIGLAMVLNCGGLMMQLGAMSAAGA